MTVTHHSPSTQALVILKALQAAVQKNLEQKKKLGQYAVLWHHGKPVQTGADAPTA